MTPVWIIVVFISTSCKTLFLTYIRACRGKIFKIYESHNAAPACSFNKSFIKCF